MRFPRPVSRVHQPFAGFSVTKPWLPVPPAHVDLAVDRQEGVAGSVLSHYRQMLAFRKAHGALIDGDLEFLATNQDLLVFTRSKGTPTYHIDHIAENIGPDANGAA